MTHFSYKEQISLALGTSSSLAPFRIEPRFVGRVWGFRDLRPWYNRTVAEGEDPIGEVWLTGDANLVATGSFAGKRLDAVFAEAGRELLGASAPETTSPLLAKMLFAADKLRVQVHPDDRMAQKYGEPRGKTECWYALDAKPGAKMAVGLKPGVTLDEVKAQIAAGTLEQSLNAVEVKAGDMIFVDAGTVHAIWPGAIVLETQQNCDLTYRMYDYGRPRELHVEKSLEATRLATRAGKVAPVELADRTVLIDEAYFRVERVPVQGSISSEALRGHQPAGLAYLFAAAGAARIEGEGFEPVELPARSIAAVPAATPSFQVVDLGGLDLIHMTPNWPGRAR
jgi:mannose-6-phosphate isomerase